MSCNNLTMRTYGRVLNLIVMGLILTMSNLGLALKTKIYSSDNKKAEHIRMATWNVQHFYESKWDTVLYNSKERAQQTVGEFLIKWIDDKGIDLVGLQEVYENMDREGVVEESVIYKLRKNLPSNYSVIKGSAIRTPMKQGGESAHEICPFIINQNKLSCSYKEKKMVNMAKHKVRNQYGKLVRDTRKAHLLFCETRDKQMDFYVACVHTQYNGARDDIKKLGDSLDDVYKKTQNINKDFYVMGDFNIDRNSVSSSWARMNLYQGKTKLILQSDYPSFIKGSLFNIDPFTKLGTKKNPLLKNKNIYDDIIWYQSSNPEHVKKYIEPLINEYFTYGLKVDWPEVLALSDHLPVVMDLDPKKDQD